MHKNRRSAAVQNKRSSKRVAAAHKTPKRNVALADIKARVSSVRNIGKLTKALQLVATAQLRTATRQLNESRAFALPIRNSWVAPAELTVKPDTSKPEAFIAIATDRSLCGAVNGNLFKAIRPVLNADKIANRPGSDLKVTVIGEKGRSGLEREYKTYFRNVFTDVARCRELTFKQTSMIADTVLQDAPSRGSFFYNHFVNAMTYEQRRHHFYDAETMLANTGFGEQYENEGDAETFQNFHEYHFAATTYNLICENIAAEISARMSAMSTSSKNAEEIAFLLNRYYNRTRQAKITGELIEINSGAQVIAEQQNQ